MKHYKLSEVPEEWVTPVFARQFFTGEQITLAFITLKKGCVVPEHSHDSEQFSYVSSGSMHFKIGDQELTVSAGEVVHIPSWVPHSAVAIVDSTGIDAFSPIRKDWLDGSDDYLRR